MIIITTLVIGTIHAIGKHDYGKEVLENRTSKLTVSDIR